MDSQDAPLAILLFGGHVLSGVLGLALLLPYFRFLPRRYLLCVALLATPAGFGYLTFFDLLLTGQFPPAILPPLVSALFFAAFGLLTLRTRPKPSRRAWSAALLILPMAWGHFFSVAFVHSCFLGACV
ncbi:MAG: hypothetical protein GKS02_05535 [Alphaproteobacteria bacterium]|nr:hypothetical protein [Alphaproteobacteria bacterium]